MKIFLILLGSFIIAYTVLAKLIGLPEITDFMPVHWIHDMSAGEKYIKIVSSTEPSYLWLYVILSGVLLIIFGLLVGYLKKEKVD